MLFAVSPQAETPNRAPLSIDAVVQRLDDILQLCRSYHAARLNTIRFTHPSFELFLLDISGLH